MLGSGDALTWLVTVWFAALGAFALVALARARDGIERGSAAAHALMCLAMAAMPWPWSMEVPPLASLLVFSALALWYAGLAVFRPSDSHHDRVPVPGYHAVMMAAMAWMAVLMSAMPAHAGMHQHGVAAPLPAWATPLNGGFVVVFAAAALWYLLRLARPGPTPPEAGPLPATVEFLAGLGMALGMGGSFLFLS